jgi:hypothetical protein
MVNKFFFIFLCSFLPILADDGSNVSNKNLQVGRYQMVGTTQHNSGVRLYLLDTATGCVWRSTNKNNWVEHDSWQLQIPGFQNNLYE